MLKVMTQYMENPDTQSCADAATTFNNALHAIDPTLRMAKMRMGGAQAALAPVYQGLFEIKGADGKTLEQGFAAVKANLKAKCPKVGLK